MEKSSIRNLYFTLYKAWFYTKFIWIFGGFFPLVTSCSRDTETIVDNSDYYSGTDSLPATTKSTKCIREECSPISMSSRIEGASNGVFRGVVGQPLSWKIQGYDPLSEKEKSSKSRRKVVVLLNRLPEKALVKPNLSKDPLASVVTVDWVPQNPQEGWLEIILRDHDRCLALESNPDVCQKYVLLSDYDTRQQAIPWIVTPAPSPTR